MINAVVGLPRHGKTYLVASMIPGWLQEYFEEMVKVEKKVSYPEGPEFPVGCLYLNISLKIGVGKLEELDNCEKLGCTKREEKDEFGKIFFKWSHKDNCIIGDIYNPTDLWNPEKLIFYWSNIYEWNFMERRGRIVADEGQRYFNSRQWALLSPDTEIKLQQHGKEDLDLWLTVQNFNRLDVTLRTLVEQIYVITMVSGDPNNKSEPWYKWPGKKIQIDTFYYTDLDNEGLPKEGREPLSTETMYLKKEIKMIYNTRERVGRSGMMPLRHILRYCEDDHCPEYGRISGKPKIVHL